VLVKITCDLSTNYKN